MANKARFLPLAHRAGLNLSSRALSRVLAHPRDDGYRQARDEHLNDKQGCEFSVLVVLRGYINRPKDSDFDLPGSREGQRVVIRPLAGARGYRKVQSSKDVGFR